MKQIQELDRIFNPSSLAVVGASKNEQRGGGFLLRGLIDNGFAGKLYPVNPRESEIMGLRSFRSILDIPGRIDLVIVAVPARIVPQVIAECSQKGVKFAIVHSAGFSELGTEGKGLEEEMLRFARQGGVRIIGPNCMGLFCPETSINTIIPYITFEKEAGPVAFVGQSGWVTENVIQMGYERGLRFSKVVSIGNQSDLTIEDLLEYFANDAKTKVIAFYMEGLKRGREFLQLARQISRTKPIIVWKSGRTEVGARAAASHTGSLAGNKAVFDAALAQGGVAMAQNLEELIDLIVGFTSPVLPRGNRVGLLMEAGGGAVAGADVAEASGLEVPTLSMEAQKELADKLRGIVPPFSRMGNPVDLVWIPLGSKIQPYLQCSRIMLKEVDAVVMISYAIFDNQAVKETVSLRNEMGKPIYVVPGHPGESREGMSLLTRNGIPSFTIPERAVKVLSAMVHYSNYLAQDQS